MAKGPKVLGVVIAPLATTLGPPVAASAAVTCFGETATRLVRRGDDSISGTNGQDVIVSRSDGDSVHDSWIRPHLRRTGFTCPL
jgi:hypothetical protein